MMVATLQIAFPVLSPIRTAEAGVAIILDMGQVVFDGTAQKVLDDADLRQQYLAI
jgi:branched-chain amino acid transport system ATP-binding protein